MSDHSKSAADEIARLLPGIGQDCRDTLATTITRRNELLGLLLPVAADQAAPTDDGVDDR
ncbi:hypothetical protein [Streptomyces djakartensis]|nr:hypothetical protein [Streptomyces djakartensis]